ncbi:chalcone isomerase family protein [Pandoraea terrae]
MLTAPAAAFDAAQFASRELPSAHLSGHGSLSRFGFHLYDAELFVGPDGPPPPWEVRPLMLDLRYARPFKGRSLARRSLQEMTRLQMATDADRQRWADQLAAFLPDVSAGQHLTGIFKPGDGTHFFSDGIPIGHIAGEAFARAFFGIWLDPKTSAPELRAALTGQAR